MSLAWLQVSTGRVAPLPVLLPAPFPLAAGLVLDFLRVVDVKALRTYEALQVRDEMDLPQARTWSVAQILLHRTGIDARPYGCDWGLGVSLTRETLVLFGRGKRDVDEIPTQLGLAPMAEWYLSHLPSLDVVQAEADYLTTPGARERG